MENEGISTSEPSQAFRERKYFDDLNGLRAISIIMVVYFHVTAGASDLAQSGVNLFFVISGFLITTLLVREHTYKGSINLGKFYMRRALRIFPAYYAVIAIQLALLQVFSIPQEIEQNFYHNLLYYLTYTQNWFVVRTPEHPVLFYHAWSLATEEQFYLVWPIILIATRSWKISALVMFMLLLFDYSAEFLVHENEFGYSSLSERVMTSLAAPICLGSIFALLCHAEATFKYIDRALSGRYIVLAPLLLWALSLVYGLKLMEHLSLTALVVCSCIRKRTFLSNLLRLRFLRYIGEVSYGMYLMHMLAVNFVRRVLLPDLEPGNVLVFACSLILTIVASSLSFHLYEKRFLDIRSHYR